MTVLSHVPQGYLDRFDEDERSFMLSFGRSDMIKKKKEIEMNTGLLTVLAAVKSTN